MTRELQEEFRRQQGGVGGAGMGAAGGGSKRPVGKNVWQPRLAHHKAAAPSHTSNAVTTASTASTVAAPSHASNVVSAAAATAAAPPIVPLGQAEQAPPVAVAATAVEGHAPGPARPAPVPAAVATEAEAVAAMAAVATLGQQLMKVEAVAAVATEAEAVAAMAAVATLGQQLMKAVSQFASHRKEFLQFREVRVGLRVCPHALVGRTVRVLWPDDDAWYCGRVEAYQPVTGKHRVSVGGWRVGGGGEVKGGGGGECVCGGGVSDCVYVRGGGGGRVCLCVCVCDSVCVWGGGAGGRERLHLDI